jgi:predicted DNA-binding protein
MMNADERLAVRLPASDKHRFKERAEAEGKTSSELLLMLIRNYLETDIVTKDESIERLLKVEAEVNALKSLEAEVMSLKQKYLGELVA